MVVNLGSMVYLALLVILIIAPLSNAQTG